MKTVKPGNNHILLVTDDEHEKEMTSFMLSCGGFNTNIALTSERALLLAAKTRFDVVIIDMGSRKYDGMDLAQRLAGTIDFSANSLIAIDAPDNAEARSKLTRLGCRSFIDATETDQLCSIIQTQARAM